MIEAVEKVADFAQEIVEEGLSKVRLTAGRVYHNTVNFLRTRKRAYQVVFATHAGQLVLADLAKFCRAETTCFNADPRLHAVLEGRREVWLRIQAHLNRSPTELNAMFGGVNIPGEQV